MTEDPWRVLGIPPDVGADEIRAARRRLAKEHHPDTGGDPVRMRAINEAAARALAVLDAHGAVGTASTATSRAASQPAAGDPMVPPRDDHRFGEDTVHVRDVPSFTVEALPVDAFEALRVVTTWLGEEIDDDPPYRLDTLLGEPTPCWCRLDLVPDAGASTVSITIGRHEGHRLPPVESVRDAWVDALNRLGEEPLPW